MNYKEVCNLFDNNKNLGFLKCITYLIIFSDNNNVVSISNPKLCNLLNKNVRSVRRYTKKAKILKIITLIKYGTGKVNFVENPEGSRFNEYLVNPIFKNDNIFMDKAHLLIKNDY